MIEFGRTKPPEGGWVLRIHFFGLLKKTGDPI